MYSNNLNEEKIVLEVRDLVNDIDNVKENLDSYCEFLKQVFLSGSGRN